MTKRIIRFGVIGCGLMGREFGAGVTWWAWTSSRRSSQRV